MVLSKKRKDNPARLLIADDHEVVREGYMALFGKDKQLEFIGGAGNGKELLDMVPKLNPDIVITDIKMPIMDGVEATKILSEKYPKLPVIAFTVFGEENLVMQMLRAGARGFLTKGSSREDLREAIQAIQEDRNYFCRETTMVLARLIGKSDLDLKAIKPAPAFTQRDEQIIRYICEEKSNKEIASLLGVGIRSIETSREKIQKKIGVKNTAGTVIYAIKAGIYKLCFLGVLWPQVFFLQG